VFQERTLFSPPSATDVIQRCRALPAASQLFVPHVPAGSRPVTPAVSIRAHEPADTGPRITPTPRSARHVPAERVRCRQRRPEGTHAAPAGITLGTPRCSHCRLGRNSQKFRALHKGWWCCQRRADTAGLMDFFKIFGQKGKLVIISAGSYCVANGPEREGKGFPKNGEKKKKKKSQEHFHIKKTQYVGMKYSILIFTHKTSA